MILIIPMPPYPGRYDIPEAVIEGIKVSDCSIGITNNSISHTTASQECLKNNHTWLSMNGTTEIIMLSKSIFMTGTKKLKEITEKAHEALIEEVCQITSDLGMDVTFKLW